MNKQQAPEVLDALHEALVAAADPERAIGMEAYMKQQFNFLGLSKPARALLQKPFLKELHALGFSEIEMLRCGWDKPVREWQYVAIDYALKQSKNQGDNWPAIMEYCITKKSWWDTVDALAAHGLGDWILRNPQKGRIHIEKWRYSDNIWLKRSCIIHQLFFKEKTDLALLKDLCLQFKDEKEFFIQKAMGWALRQYARTDAAAVLDFVQSTKLPSLTKREAMKHLKA